jgi:hypothetical protein
VVLRSASSSPIAQGFADSSGTPGNATINQPSGRSAIAAVATTAVITNSLVTAASRVLVTLRANDTTAVRVAVTTAAGSFTVTANAAATAALPFDWLVVS